MGIEPEEWKERRRHWGRLVLPLLSHPHLPGRPRAARQQVVTAITRRMFWHGLRGL